MIFPVAPARERGLKYQLLLVGKERRSRSRKGAWIEIVYTHDIHGDKIVAPARERGLKSSSMQLWRLLTCRSRKGAWIEIFSFLLPMNH